MSKFLSFEQISLEDRATAQDEGTGFEGIFVKVNEDLLTDQQLFKNAQQIFFSDKQGFLRGAQLRKMIGQVFLERDEQFLKRSVQVFLTLKQDLLRGEQNFVGDEQPLKMTAHVLLTIHKK